MAIFKDKTGRELSAKEALPKIKNRFWNILLELEVMLLRWVGHIPLHSVRKFFYQLAGLKIGKGSTIHMWCNFFDPRGIMIGEDTIVGENAFLDGRAPLKIGNHVDIASQVLIYNSQHDIDSEDFHPIEASVEIGDYVFIGPRVIIQPGVKIGEGAVVAAGAVVAKDAGPYTVIGGIPAQFIRERKAKDLHYKLGRARLFR